MLISLMQVPSVGVSDVRHKSLIPQGEAPYCEIFPNCGSWFQGWGFWQDHDSDSPTHLNVALLSFVAEEPLASFQVFFRGIVLYVAIDLVCLWEKVSSRSSYTSILNLLSTSSF